MQTIKSTIVVVLLLTVCYGAFKAMNASDVEMPEDLKAWADQNGKDVLPDFEIPAITSNDTFGSSNLDKSTGASDNSSPLFPAELTSTNLSNGFSPPSQPGANAVPQIDLPNLPPISSSLASPTLENANTLNSNSFPHTIVANNQAPSATFPNLPPTQTAPNLLAPNAPGPNIPFNPGTAAGNLASNPLSNASLLNVDNSALGSDLIDAGSGGIDSPLIQDHAAETALPPASFTSLPISEPNSDTANAQPTGVDQKSSQPTQPYSVARTEALQIASQGKLRDALELMSQYYESPELGYAEHTDLVDMLDALTREVIYSDRHLLASPHTVSAQDSLLSLAGQFNLNPEFLAAVNKMGSSQALVPNSQIKVLEGPFHAQVSLSRGELTLFLRKLYAGRFPVSISQKNRPPQAKYEVVDRRQDRTYYGANIRIPAGDPTNPYGGFWLSLGNDFSIHGSPEQVTTDLENAGCISLAPLDAADVYRILGKGSAVEIKP